MGYGWETFILDEQVALKKLHRVPARTITEAVLWARENCTNQVAHHRNNFYFTNSKDAFAFRIKWGQYGS